MKKFNGEIKWRGNRQKTPGYRKLTALNFCGLFPFFILALFFTGAQAGNLISDSEFKESATVGKSSGWSFSNDWERVTDAPRPGAYSMKTERTGTCLSRHIPMEEGADYWLSFFCKGEGRKGAKASLTLTCGNKRFFNFSFTAEPKWREVRLLLPRLRKPEKMTLQFCLSQGGSLFISNVNLEKLSMPVLQSQLLADFEIDADLLEIKYPAGKAGELERSADFASRGNFSLKLTYDNAKTIPVWAFSYLHNRNLWGYKSISCDIFNPAAKDIAIYPIVRTDLKGLPNLWCQPVMLKAKAWTHLELDLYTIVNALNNQKKRNGDYFVPEKELKLIYFFFYGARAPGKRTALYLDNIQLNAYSADSNRKVPDK